MQLPLVFLEMLAPGEVTALQSKPEASRMECAGTLVSPSQVPSYSRYQPPISTVETDTWDDQPSRPLSWLQLLARLLLQPSEGPQPKTTQPSLSYVPDPQSAVPNKIGALKPQVL